jgi:hypothetical protein
VRGAVIAYVCIEARSEIIRKGKAPKVGAPEKNVSRIIPKMAGETHINWIES